MKPTPLVVIPSYLREPDDVKTTLTAVESVRKTEPHRRIDILVVDDGSPEPDLVDLMEEGCESHRAEVVRKADNTGFSKTVNVGLQRALEEGRDAILMNADLECHSTGWLGAFQNTLDDKGRPAAVVGALLMYPNGLIQHGGIYFSLLSRSFDHLWKYAPADLPDANESRYCPVTGAFQFIRHETLTTVGLYDEGFSMAWEDVDYCLRVIEAGLRCVYNPKVRAYHYEMMFRGRPSPKVAEWQVKSYARLAHKWAHANFQEMVPFT
jgi:GT2 family glycosyltransferase